MSELKNCYSSENLDYSNCKNILYNDTSSLLKLNDDNNNLNLSKNEFTDVSLNMENIELNSLKFDDNYNDLDIDSIEKDSVLECNEFDDNNNTPLLIPVMCNKLFNNDDKITAYSYTPERIIKNHDYRILTPSPNFFPDLPNSLYYKKNYNNNINDKLTIKKLENLIDSSKFGSRHLKELMNQRDAEIFVPVSLRYRKYLKNRSKKFNYDDDVLEKDPLNIANCDTPSDIEIPELESSTSSSISCNDFKKSYKKIPVCLSDELATASNVYTTIDSHHTKIAFNKVVEILESLDSNPDQADVLIEDRFCSGHCGHDRLTRLALSIEQEDETYVTVNQENCHDVFNQLIQKVEKLQSSTKGIFKDVEILRKDYQYEDKKMEILEIETSSLRHEVKELKYLDDLVNLLRGELNKISQRNWPFLLGHNDNSNEEINLVV
ncbi:hypothetical protein HCN44_004997 [Aphidius gifuensis]|uniref:Uncharacterized protein n=1 Tax=Aphidius gifuensis TaxID=684658 RepID=A0A834XSI3_APHGI|nr:uncharacterized protein LOC122852556 [Aphidius gifuensis]KAF7992653.1 hypothetical protein HCN44_004997 [Aphidius gifuensis]